MAEDMAAEVIRTRIWREEPEPDNPFAAAVCRCHGYDVHGDLLGRASFIEYLYLLFRGEAPTPAQAGLLDGLAVALANPGPRDPSVHAAMAGGIGGSTSAACLTAALAVGAGGLGGAREVYRVMSCLRTWGCDLAAWSANLPDYADGAVAEVWPASEHVPGFDPHGVTCPAPVRQALAHLAGLSEGPYLPWLLDRRSALEAFARRPLAMSAVAAAALADLNFDAEQGEMLTLLLRLPGAAVHALEQRGHGYREFPFFRIELVNDPGPAAAGRGGEAA
jgi:citrate synthase